MIPCDRAVNVPCPNLYRNFPSLSNTTTGLSVLRVKAYTRSLASTATPGVSCSRIPEGSCSQSDSPSNRMLFSTAVMALTLPRDFRRGFVAGVDAAAGQFPPVRMRERVHHEYRLHGIPLVLRVHRPVDGLF